MNDRDSFTALERRADELDVIVVGRVWGVVDT